MRPSQFFYRILIAVSSECVLRIGVCVSIFEKRARIFFKAVLDVEDCAREIIVVWDECVFFGFVDLLELSLERHLRFFDLPSEESECFFGRF